MSIQNNSSKSMTAAELMAQLQNDPEYQRKMQEEEAERQVRVQELRRAEQPIVADLRSAGIEVDSVWDLVNTSVPYPAALPVLLKHLQLGGYPDRVMESMGRALAVKPAVFAWDTLKELYLKAGGRGEEVGLAAALAASATSRHLEALIDLLGDDSRGDTRILFLSEIKRVGGSRGRKVLEALKSDPLFGKEARALLKS
ncbi:hypothetical protein [Arthrobacter bambusae]|uniref:HEAT repeat domain-containing protein n=1 Tax=Arthrobacter bambusae TaxID=1338426 RepID=A0AAW8D9Y0_9MICC|nr:hypothetical protein [Arthrobacter bambusae]MDP9903105.1 hypothetical protein [Arthrobacter bambusae]MDQ0128901.1 hypothetical protein [Arthrobacter bambusae]MDQ0180242.1 hypothetical protein [Arthrobacter bambusae]